MSAMDVSLREYVDRCIAELDKRVSQRFELIDKALTKAEHGRDEHRMTLHLIVSATASAITSLLILYLSRH